MHFSIARGTTNVSGGPLHAGPLHAQRDADVNACSRYDIYFIGVSLPSSMMIYNCCSLGCNYYNYRFFVWALGTGPRPGPGPDALFAPSPSMRLHPFGPPSLGPLVPVPVCAFLPLSLSLSIGLAFSLSIPLARCSFYLANRDQIYGGSDVETGFGSWTRAMSSPRARLLRNLCLCPRLRLTLNLAIRSR